ncbi:antibiotic biosynthesis monooxygenase [Novosphingobium sp.]|uniref:antibiotic biosynthesis monooxygenase family protein n=1 Tax=Novosphingobium sp. TaxID=1874826 RepID=UPI0022BB5CAA|nr:antibiotic biosynthesis monooxygenase [Novosphingobium sp.]MCZ8019684.1 antibiotic biosynthesis monooxygenase [Novosphingobium sp.]MCZ8035499.1 antibiotic biosynthesis monooxygenase [Novosphingobium sp.]MCZ8050813.1 antibiotic biosynthesis monooxygenase [Novosphingobium sp.]MCZ8059159.1 antibiotic biosynthesis monooxygenase [Novosphingobium sp.]MCZ8232605.1 antibiotic biosynthesis monooxygenase [Novosphingobium sp.]
MIAVIFEVEPAPGQNETYLDTAAGLRPLLDEIEGFISVERFQSLTNPGKLVSLSFFENEEAVRRWRETAEHRAAQSAGRSGVFADYRLRVASVIRDYSLHNRKEVPLV